MARRRSRSHRSLAGLGLAPYDHLREALDYTKDLERLAKGLTGKGCPSAERLVEDGELIGRIKANLNYSSPESRQAALEPRFAPLHKDVRKRYMDAVLLHSRKIREGCGFGPLKGLAGHRRRSRR